MHLNKIESPNGSNTARCSEPCGLDSPALPENASPSTLMHLSHNIPEDLSNGTDVLHCRGLGRGRRATRDRWLCVGTNLPVLHRLCDQVLSSVSA